MLFNSLSFFVFFPLVTAAYFLLDHKYRWMLLLSTSCVFYMWFIPKYIVILAVTIVIDYIAGVYLERTQGAQKKALLILSIVSTCLVLIIFKYFHFMDANLKALADFIGWNYSLTTLSIVLPVGLSFHTFQSLSYVIEVYRGHQKAERHFGIYSLYVMFYPQLVAGPIERPQNLLHQFRERMVFDDSRVSSGLRRMAWGLFKKVVIADRLAILVNQVYSEPTSFNGPILVLATVFFAFQIYCDFSGYSDIAIGAARVMGFKLMENFDRPYAARTVSEFWRRWHISLSTWFKDYVYVSLGGNRRGFTAMQANLLVTFLLSGLWHGANWTYVIWGGLNGAFLICANLTKNFRGRITSLVGLDAHPRLHDSIKLVATFALICLTWVYFRAATVTDGNWIITHLALGWGTLFAHVATFNFAAIADGTLLGRDLGMSTMEMIWSVILISLLNVFETARSHGLPFTAIQAQPVWIRWPLYYVILILMVFYGVYGENQFIYFQF